MPDSHDLTTLQSTSRGVTAFRWLCCPACSGAIELRLRRYCCNGNCRDSWATLGELGVKGERG